MKLFKIRDLPTAPTKGLQLVCLSCVPPPLSDSRKHGNPVFTMELHNQ